jgi:hypothetical protein
MGKDLLSVIETRLYLYLDFAAWLWICYKAPRRLRLTGKLRVTTWVEVALA